MHHSNFPCPYHKQITAPFSARLKDGGGALAPLLLASHPLAQLACLALLLVATQEALEVHTHV